MGCVSQPADLQTRAWPVERSGPSPAGAARPADVRAGSLDHGGLDVPARRLPGLHGLDHRDRPHHRRRRALRLVPAAPDRIMVGQRRHGASGVACRSWSPPRPSPPSRWCSCRSYPRCSPWRGSRCCSSSPDFAFIGPTARTTRTLLTQGMYGRAQTPRRSGAASAWVAAGGMAAAALRARCRCAPRGHRRPRHQRARTRRRRGVLSAPRDARDECAPSGGWWPSIATSEACSWRTRCGSSRWRL